MRKLVIPAGLAVIVLAAVGVYAFVLAGGQRPMNGQIELWGGPTGAACDAGSFAIELQGTGTLAHLGRVDVAARNCSTGDVSVESALILDGSATFAAADGSTITVTYDGSQQQAVANISAYTTTHTVTGGTGRFANARGEWTIAGTVDISIGKLVGEVSGWLSY